MATSLPFACGLQATPALPRTEHIMLHGTGERSALRTVFFFIPGYGVPDSLADDKNYPKYVQEAFGYILEYVERRKPNNVTIVLSGCATNPRRTGFTEASALHRFVGLERDLYQQITYAMPDGGTIKIVEIHDAVDLRQGMLRFATMFGQNDEGERDVILFSEHRGRWRARAIARKVLKKIPHKVIGVDFDHGQWTWEKSIARLAGIGSAVLSNASHEWYDGYELPRRLKKIGYDANKKRRR